MGNIIKIGSVELTKAEAQRFIEEGRYIVTYSRIYQIIKKGDTFHGKQVHASKGMTRRGRFFAMTAETISNVFDFQLPEYGYTQKG